MGRIADGIRIGPEDVTCLELTFFHPFGQVRLGIDDDRELIEGLWVKIIETYGPGGPKALPVEMERLEPSGT